MSWCDTSAVKGLRTKQASIRVSLSIKSAAQVQRSLILIAIDKLKIVLDVEGIFF